MKKFNFYHLKRISVHCLGLIILGSSSIGYAMNEGQPSLENAGGRKRSRQVDDSDRSSLYLAAAQGNTQTVEALLSADINSGAITYVNHLGWTVLHAAAYHGHLDVVKCLIAKHPSLLWMTTHSGKTALDLAYDEKIHDIIDYLTNETLKFNTIFTPDQTQRNFTCFLGLNTSIPQFSQNLATAKQEEETLNDRLDLEKLRLNNLQRQLNKVQQKCYALENESREKKRECQRLATLLEATEISWGIEKDNALPACQAIATDQRNRLLLSSSGDTLTANIKIKKEES